MKKIISIVSIAVAAMAMFSSCNKSEVKNDILPSKVYTAYNMDTKTALENTSVIWSETDAVIGVDEDFSVMGHTSTQTVVSDGGHKAEFTIPGGDMYYVVYPASAVSGADPDEYFIQVEIPETQTAVENSFADNANISMAFPYGETTDLYFLNAVALLKVNIKNDDITKITFKSSIPLAGKATMVEGYDEALDAAVPDITPIASSENNSVTLQGDFKKGSSYYIAVFPSGFQKYYDTEIVFTDKKGRTASYANDPDMALVTKRGQATLVWDSEIADNKWQGGSGSEYFVKVTEEPADWTGEYLIVYENENGDIAFDGSLGTLDAVGNSKSVTISDEKIEATADMKNIMFTVDYKTGSSTVYSLKSASGYYISGSTVNATAANGLKTSTTDENYEISFGIENANAVVYSQSSDQKMTLRYNDASNQTRFRFFKSGQKAISLYKLNVPVVTKYSVNCASVDNGTISASPVKAAEGATVTLSATPNSGYEFESWDVTGATVVDATSATTTFIMPAADVNVSATFKASVIPDKTIAEFIAAEGVQCYLTGVVSNITSITFGNYTLTDASGSIVIYGTLNQDGESKKFAELGVVAGDKIKVLASEYELYQETTDEAKNVTFVEIVTPAPRYAVSVASGVANGTVAVDLSQAAEGQTVTITATPNSGYKVKSVSAKKTASGTALTVTENNQFTMPAEAVTVSAEFEVNASGETTASIDFSKQGYTNGQEIKSVTIDDNVTITFDKGTNSNAPKYYTSGTAIRCYGSNTITVKAEGKTITAIKLKFGSGDGTNPITTDVNSFTSPDWSGSSESVVFTIGGSSGNRRISGVEVTYN